MKNSKINKTGFAVTTIGLLGGLPLLLSIASAAQTPSVPAFPGAEGYGARATGGRGGRVIAVTNLNDSGPGSLREAVEANGPRIVVFRVSGNIDLKSTLSIRNGDITIAGQTAPGDGICLRNYGTDISKTSNVILRYVRFRPGDLSGKELDALGGRYSKDIIIDHISASWSVDETVSFYHCENFTLQWSIISESLFNSNHHKGSHGFGAIWGSNYSTYHHNLLSSHSSRNPRFASGSGFTDYRNNVVYNWGSNSTYGGEQQQQNSSTYIFSTINMVANYYKPGPATISGNVSHRIVNPSSRKLTQDYGKWYVAGNVMEGNKAVTADNWNGGVQPQDGKDYLAGLKLDKPWDSMPIQQQTAKAAYASVLQKAGATLPKRDSIDARILAETRSGTATYEGKTYKTKVKTANPAKKSGIIDRQQDVGGWVELKSLPAPLDSDNDGMPDKWELRFGLNPKDASDGALDKDNDGYTNVEEYLNGTNPTKFVDYTKAANNVNTIRA